jgi:4-carboxymuconolactone decarboxylase
MPRLPMPSDTEGFSEEARAAVRHILQTRHSLPPPSSYLTYAGRAGALRSDLVDHLRYHTSLTPAETELAICTSARASNADFIWNAHAGWACRPARARRRSTPSTRTGRWTA